MLPKPDRATSTTQEGVKVARSGAGRRYHHGNLREALVDAAVELARTGGPEAVVLRAVSRAAGVSHNAAYRHFADHGDLLAAVSSRCMTRLAALMRERTAEVTARGAGRRARTRLEAIGRAYVEFARTEPGWFRTAFAVPASSAEQLRGLPDGAAGDDSPFLLLSARLDELVSAGELPAARRPGAEYAAWSAVHGVSTLLVDGPLRGLPEADARRAVDAAVRVVLDGL